MKQTILRPGDVAVALQLAITPDTTLAITADATGRSVGEIHNGVRRLVAAGLVDAAARRVFREPLLRFIRWGVPHAFPVTLGGPAIGIPTGWDAPGARGEPQVNPTDGEGSGRVLYVWPTANGEGRGIALQPLYPITSDVATRNPQLWLALAMVDAIRLGGAREGDAAARKLAAVVHGSNDAGT